MSRLRSVDRTRLVTAITLAVAALGVAAPARAASGEDGWRASWGSGMGTLRAEDGTAALLQSYFRLSFPDLRAHDQTLREVVRTSVGGDAVRVRVSNALGDGPLVIGHAAVALHGAGAVPVALTFGGRRGTTLVPGADRLSDPVALAVPGAARLDVSLHVVDSPPAPTLHFLALTGSTATAPGSGDHTADPSDAAFTIGYRHWPWLDAVDVHAPQESGSVVAFGDSITDGAYVGNAFTESKDQSWPSVLAGRLAKLPADRYARGVVNVGISGNTVSAPLAAWVGPPAVRRLERDVLTRTGITHLILFEGTNDLGAGAASATAVAAGLKLLAARAHARGLTVLAATITPRADTDPPLGEWTSAKNAERRALNAWIRDYRGFDGVIDLDRALADPADPDRLRPDYDSGDHLHPGPSGRAAMADAVDLELLRCVPAPVLTIDRAGGSGTLRLAGTAVLGACRSAALGPVTVAVSRPAPGGRCRFLRATGTLGAPRRCGRPLRLPARRREVGWAFAAPAARLPRGAYRVTARVVAGGVAVTATRTLRVP